MWAPRPTSTRNGELSRTTAPGLCAGKHNTGRSAATTTTRGRSPPGWRRQYVRVRLCLTTDPRPSSAPSSSTVGHFPMRDRTKRLHERCRTPCHESFLNQEAGPGRPPGRRSRRDGAIGADAGSDQNPKPRAEHALDEAEQGARPAPASGSMIIGVTRTVPPKSRRAGHAMSGPRGRTAIRDSSRRPAGPRRPRGTSARPRLCTQSR